MTCRTCGSPCEENGDCAYQSTHRGRGTDLKADTVDRVHRFLALSDEMPDDEPMWMVGGIRLNWGDLRALADYDRPPGRPSRS